MTKVTSPPSGCWVPASAKSEEFLLRPRARPYGPMGKLPKCCTSTGQDKFQWSSNGVNQPSGYWVIASVRVLLRPWACPCGSNGQMTMTLHIYRPTRFPWTWFLCRLAVCRRAVDVIKWGWIIIFFLALYELKDIIWLPFFVKRHFIGWHWEFRVT